LGYKSKYDSGTKTLTITDSKDTIKIKIGSYNFTFNDAIFLLDVPAQIKNGTAMMPLNDVLRKIDYRADYFSETKTVVIDVDYVMDVWATAAYPGITFQNCGTVFGKYIQNCKWTQIIMNVPVTYNASGEAEHVYIFIEGQIPATGAYFFAKGGTSISICYELDTLLLNVQNCYVDLGGYGSASGSDAEELIRKFFLAYRGEYKTLDGYLAYELAIDAATDYIIEKGKEAAWNWLKKKAGDLINGKK